ncbi:MAG TPA: caspase family protein [Bacteroidales bacterium]|nr:caspase family protein [Bacteroidales bacterium]
MKKALTLLMVILYSACITAQKYDLGDNNQPTRTVLFTPDSRYLVAGGFMKIYNMDNGSEVFSATSITDQYTANLILQADISNDGRYMVMAKQGRIEIFDLQARRPVSKVRALNMIAAALAPDNKTLVYARTNGNIVFYDIPSGKKLSSHKLGRLKPSTLDWSDSGELLAIGTRGDMVLVYDVKKKEIFRTIKMRKRAVADVVFSADSRYLAVASTSGEVKLIDTENGETLHSWNAHSGAAYSLSFHPSGKYLASGGADNKISIWQVPSCKAVMSWQAHEKSVLALDFSPDGSMLASGCMNGPLMGASDTRVWSSAGRGIEISSTVADAGSETVSDQQQESSVTGREEVIEQATIKAVSNELQATEELPQKRLALVIGNGIYANGGILSNPENDANDIADRLKNLGFDVMLFNNVDQKNFKKAIDNFGMRLSTYDIGLFYYAGHGIQVKGNNYLIPVDANLQSENDVEYDCVNAGRLLAKMEDAGSTTNIIILDACRDNPFERSWRRSTQGKGLAFMTAPAGSLISYATSPGSTAADGSGRNGLFTTALLEYIDNPDLSILEMFQKVRTWVRENSDGRQVPWESTSLEGNFYFKME